MIILGYSQYNYFCDKNVFLLLNVEYWLQQSVCDHAAGMSKRF